VRVYVPGERFSKATIADVSREPASVEYVGHSTVRIELDGVRLLTDPLLRSRVAHLRRAVPPPIDATRNVDAVLVSHAHYDHLDLPSLSRLGGSVPVVVPRGLGALLRRRRFERVIEVDEGEQVSFGPVTVRAVHADHEGDRGPFGTRAQALGYAVLGSRRVYFAGDTDLFDGMQGLIDELDVALIPIWGWGPSLGRGRHLDPEQAAEALRRLRPRTAVPIHWGTYHPVHHGLRRAPAFLSYPVGAFVAAARVRAPGVDVRVLAPGETLRI
jgi:L-ascorbate metabolism protein UlaG (beta-lactamase superfamily)